MSVKAGGNGILLMFFTPEPCWITFFLSFPFRLPFVVVTELGSSGFMWSSIFFFHLKPFSIFEDLRITIFFFCFARVFTFVSLGWGGGKVLYDAIFFSNSYFSYQLEKEKNHRASWRWVGVFLPYLYL